MNWAARIIGGRFHYGWLAVAVVFLVLLAAAGTRATPSVMMVPLEHDFGWSRATISLAISVNIALYGLMGPFAAAAMQRFGVRPTILTALGTMAAGVGLSSLMTHPWQMILVWGVMVGGATGVAALTLSATVVNRWFSTHRGLVMGILTASSATGQLVFLPLLAAIAQHHGWRPVVWTVAIAAALVLPLVAFLLPERPADMALRPVGEPADSPIKSDISKQNPLAIAFGTLAMASKTRDFWLLFFSFFICGASTNGYVGTHLIAMCGDYGMTEVQGASLLAAMGIFDLFGTTLSGWLSDRFNARVLLFWYYGLRGLSLMYLPHAFGIDFFGLPLFAVFYGLDWIATVPPTVRLATDVYGKDSAPVVFGWVVAGHQLGAAFAALGAGMLRASLGTYTVASMISGGLCLVASIIVLRINRTERSVAAQAV
ncbi:MULTISPECIES: MFS transporter [Paraburkholderia]|jgi:predicted MFS family arabinose efflux permease|uniref:MFS transporter n=1 Tax=Paraburkholderia largidicola TaxID=3014751 RepID=A0A7I8BMA6_9BURK|nr:MULTISPECIES: MFS transporter [Paraburkholderia]BCF89812.1 MFS transporter [Paraburkholderia sp. PGU16]BEU22776.1 MFS transporter [Paraburkholderia sp. 22B1P]GJH36820.1 MFS transporter [Paraburkholderia hospita]CAG9270602.1 Permeases of the major facilitator superfamily [Paraburkholderia caribensis]